jgi:two-component system probable response regulator PhcQ
MSEPSITPLPANGNGNGAAGAAAAASKYAKYAVLYVDDEEQALKYFRKGLEKEFSVLTASNISQAMEILQRDAGKVAVLITDQRMPGGSGTDLLTEVRQRWPAIVRIITTAYSEIDDAIKAVNAGAIFKYLTKPVDFAVMRQTMRSAFDLFLSQGERDTMLQIKMSSLRRMVVADRVASLSNMSYGLVQHMRNSLTAMCCFLDEVEPTNTSNGDGQKYPSELWKLASEERDRLLKMLETVQTAVRGPVCRFNDEIPPEQLLRSAADAIAKSAGCQVSCEVAPHLGKVKIDAQQVVVLLKMLGDYVARHGRPGGKLTLAAAGAVPLWNSTAMQIFISGEGEPWTDEDVATLFVPFAFPQKDPSELGLGLISAFSIAHQHGGDVLVHRSPPHGPGFELLLPQDPGSIVHPQMKDHLVQMAFA